ncbi:SAM-dependent methyltransferase [Ruegeria sp. 2012CJ41-6]|uniref:SAM-dependent methyltransferase n=1 Tax=Ruegeria spongiae TaxID=2942209 RepID=A0ABT0Q0P2_9RHOB|nr:SAM-dependent methyltransferase [Ruegeria spongiae]MCL6283353.1 SAM-dependent methyltransferase [Ruegeria spongiae]
MSLHALLLERISQSGPLTVAEYMSDCLLHPDFGYYATRDPFGIKGDFTTAPEISQMFGELLGLSLAQAWMDQGCPTPFTLAELGPGRGTLMADLLRATAGVPGFHTAAQIMLVEASPTMRRMQNERLASADPHWTDDIDALPQAPLFLIANEFFDALPIRQFIREASGWRERLIGAPDGVLAFGLGADVPQPGLADRMEDTTPGDLVEICDAARPVMAGIAERIAAHGGAALLVDYGDWRSLGDTLQAVRHHLKADPLAEPGQADLTAHVDFEALAQVATQAGCAHSRLTPQGMFLERLGITARAQALARTLGGSELQSLISAHRRLTHPEEMGNLFKVLGFYPAAANPPPGLEA